MDNEWILNICKPKESGQYRVRLGLDDGDEEMDAYFHADIGMWAKSKTPGEKEWYLFPVLSMWKNDNHIAK